MEWFDQVDVTPPFSRGGGGEGVSVVGVVVGVEEGCWCGRRWLVWRKVQWLSHLS